VKVVAICLLRRRPYLPALAGKIAGLRMADGPAWGRLHFRSRFPLHPSAALLLWFFVVLAVQYLAYPGLLLISGSLLLLPGVARPWLAFISRARWLLLSLWLILAYHTAGEAYADLSWAPTYEGIAEANMHAWRLIVMLGCLSWLFVRLGREGLLAGLWGLLLPAAWFGLDGERLMVRLSLVLERLQQPPEKGAWRRILANSADLHQGPAVLTLQTVAWRTRDSVLVVLAAIALIGVVAW